MNKIIYRLLLIVFCFLAGCQHIPVENAARPSLPGKPEAASNIDVDNPAPDTASQQVSSQKSSNNRTALAARHTVAGPVPEPSVRMTSDSPRSADPGSQALKVHEPQNKDVEIDISDVPAPGPDTQGPETSAQVQEKTDQALELCRIAQELWEAGRLEDALSNLDASYKMMLEIDQENFPEFNQQKEDLRFLISRRILEIYASRKMVVNGQHNEIPIVMNRYVKDEIKRLTGPERNFFIQSMERAGRFRPFILEELKKAGFPEELAWLPLIESGFKIRALSSARALGLWQFIPSTGYKFGLNRNYYIDERLDPEKATRAAIAYLKELHNLFGDWNTVLAAYNCGEGRVLKIIRQQKINYLDNFWDLYQKLPRETARYVPRFLATLHIMNNLDKFNIEISNPQMPVPAKTVKIQKQIRLKDIAKEIDVAFNDLKDLNPELRYALLPPEPYELKIPADKEKVFLARIDKIKASYPPPSRFVYHRVSRGDTLSQIAEKYHTSIRAIASVNHIYRNNKIIAGKVLKIPVKGQGGSSGDIAGSMQLAPGQKTVYTVKRGDNLWIIARRFNTTTKHIMALNNLSGTFLQVGQKLTISNESPAPAIAAAGGTATYRVKSGDSPFSIAKKHNMSLNRLLALNQLTRTSKIYPGQQLYVE